MATSQNYITDDTTIKGNITTASSLDIAGAVEGNVNAGGDIVILSDALVKGDVSGPSVRVQGKVEGRINATGKLIITAEGIVVGDISVRSLLIEEGGTLQGQCTMGNAAVPTSPSTTANKPNTTLLSATSSSPSGPS